MEKSKKRDSVCRICGDRLSFIGPEDKVLWKKGAADDDGLVCDQCVAMARLQKLREDSKRDGNR